MGKRSNFDRIERDFYPTPEEGFLPLISHLPKQKFYYTEPCAGDGALVKWITKHTKGVGMTHSDIVPKQSWIQKKDMFRVSIPPTGRQSFVITNPPWNRKILHPMIDHFALQCPTWLLFDADWPHTKQSQPYMDWLVKIVSVGRLKWIPDSKMTGKDNCCWYLFDATNKEVTQFYGR